MTTAVQERVWLSTADVMALRQEQGWVSPLAPLEPGELWCIWESRGVYEWMAHPADASAYLDEGIVVDGVRLPCVLVERWPLLNAWQIAAHKPDRADAFTEAAA